MSTPFWLVAIPFHLVLAPAASWVAARWACAPRQFGRRLFDLALLGALTIVMAAVLGSLLPDVRFAQIRLVAQALFGEGVLVLAWVATALAIQQRWLAFAVHAAPLAALISVYWVAYHVTPTDLRIEQHTLDRTRSPQRGKLRLLHLSDIQVWRVGDYEERVIRESMRLAPDIILMTGDYVQPRLRDDRAAVSKDLRALLRRRAFGARLGVFAVGGDVDGGNEHLFDGLGIRWLADEHAVVPLSSGRQLVLVGLTRSSSRMKGRLPFGAVDQAPDGDLFIVMGHGPDFVMAVAGRRRIDLALAGHTHGGQVVLPFFGPPLVLTQLPRRFAAGGLTSFEGVPLHVSRGTGMERGSAPQLRFLCPPEISLIEIRY